MKQIGNSLIGENTVLFYEKVKNSDGSQYFQILINANISTTIIRNGKGVWVCSSPDLVEDKLVKMIGRLIEDNKWE